MKLDDPTDPWSSGVAVVGGQVVIIPRNMIIELPANFLSPQQIFAQAPDACAALGESGLAAKDQCRGAVGAVATILANKTAAGDVIAGYIFLEKGQEFLTGRVSFINHTDGYFRVNGTDLDDTTGVMVRINDPDGRHTVQQGKGCAGGPNCSADPRYTNDPDNYTVVFTTGYPACIPSTTTGGNRTVGCDAAGVGDPFCPATNRNVDPVPDSTRFARIQLGDTVTVQGNYEVINGVRFLSVYDVLVHARLNSANDPTQPDYIIFDEAEWDAAGFQNERAKVLMIGFSTLADPLLDVFALHVDPTTNENHEVPLGSTVGNPKTRIAGVGMTPVGIWKIRYDVDFFEGAPVREGLSPCENLRNAGLANCPVAAHLGHEFSIISPITREIIARTRQLQEHPELKAFDIQGEETNWGRYLTPVGVGHPEFVEIDLARTETAFIFAGEPWNLDRRLHPGGCIDTDGDGVVDCETTRQPLDPFPFSNLDPRTQADLPIQAADRIFASFGPGGPATSLLPWPPVDPSFVGALEIRADITRASVREEVDCTKLDVWGESQVAGDIVASGTGLTPQTMADDGLGHFFAHVTVPIGDPVPSDVTITHGADGRTDTRPLADEVAITSATYDVAAQTLTVTGTSSTANGTATLALSDDEFVGPLSPAGDVSFTNVLVPPETVTLFSGDGGSETRQVIVNPTPPDTLTVALAKFNQTVSQWTIEGTASVPGPGNAVLGYLGDPITGTLIGAADVTAAGTWQILTAEGSPVDPNAPGAPTTLSLQSTPFGGVLTGIPFILTGTIPLVADAGADQIVAPGAVVQLDGSGSTGGVISHHWAQTAGEPVVLSDADIANPTFTFPTAPVDISLVFQLTVTRGAEVDSVTVTIFGFDPVTVPIVSSPTWDGETPYPDDPSGNPRVLVQLGSATSGGVIDDYLWVQTSGPAVTLGVVQPDGSVLPDATVPDPAFVATLTPGLSVHGFDLTITGPAGVSVGSVSVPLVFTPPPVVANAGIDQTIIPGEKTKLDGSLSTGLNLTYLWELIAGPPLPPFNAIQDPTAAVTSFFYPGLPEPLVFRLTVTSSTGESSTDTITFFR
ncbi:MAG: hypothetical protein ACE5EX_06565, partial [Phycisphaerae bacterium]